MCWRTAWRICSTGGWTSSISKKGRGRHRKADVEAGIKPGTTSAESQELREAKRRVRLLEQENEVLRRAAAYLSQANLPGKGGTRS